MRALRVYAFSSRASPDVWDRRAALQPAVACTVDAQILGAPHQGAQAPLAALARCCRTLQLLGADGAPPPLLAPLYGALFEADSLLLAADPVGGPSATAADDARLGLAFLGWTDGRGFTAGRRDAVLAPAWAYLLCACAAAVCAAQ